MLYLNFPFVKQWFSLLQDAELQSNYYSCIRRGREPTVLPKAQSKSTSTELPRKFKELGVPTTQCTRFLLLRSNTFVKLVVILLGSYIYVDNDEMLMVILKPNEYDVILL